MRARLLPVLLIGLGTAWGGDAAPGRYRLAPADGRPSVITPAGERIFLLGLNHLGEAAPREPAARAAWFAATARRLRAWGFNNLGYGTPADARSVLPYLAQIQLLSSSQFHSAAQFVYPDVFHPEFQRTTREAIRQLCAATAHDPNLIGYYWSDTPRWDIALARRRRGDDWVSAIRRLPAASAGKTAYIDFLRARHGAPARFAAAYGHAIASFDDLRSFDFREFDRENPAGLADDQVFLGRIAREWYRVCGEAFREFAPGRLIFGERYKFRDHPDAVLAEAARWIDVLSIQPGPEAGPLPGPGRDEVVFDTAEFDRLHRLTGKPILICDHQVSFHTAARPVTLWHQAADQAEAAALAGAFLRAAAAQPYIIGYQRCQYADNFRPERGNMLKQGLVTEAGVPHLELVERLTALHAEITRSRGK